MPVKSSATTGSFPTTHFTGPSGKFSIGHPSDWLERQVVRPPDLVDVAFTSPNDMRTNISVIYIPNTTLYNNTDVATLLKADINYLQRHSNAIISKPIDCNTFKIADNRACMVTVEIVGFNGTQSQRLALWTSIDGGIYALQFKDTKADFNQRLPVFLQMLTTFKPK